MPLAGALLLGLGCTPGCDSRPPPEAREAITEQPWAGRAVADHHVHLLSPALVEDWKRLGARFSREPAAYLSMAGLMKADSDARMILDAALVVPMAHLYGDADFRRGLGLTLDAEQARVRAENMGVAAEALRYGGRVTATCSVPALRPYALDELQFCHRSLDVLGLKLHLASSGVDLREADHLASVTELLAYADANGLFVLLHLDPQRRGTESTDIETFIEKVLEPYPELPISIAHLGGSGGYGAWTRTVFLTLVEWLERERASGRGRDKVYFDLSAVVLKERREGLDATTIDELDLLAGDLRSLGFSQLLFGSDYPVFMPHSVLDSLVDGLKLTPAEVDQLLVNRFPGPETGAAK